MSITPSFRDIRTGSGARKLLLAASVACLAATSLPAQIAIAPQRKFQYTYNSAGEHTRKCHPLERTKGGDYLMVGTTGSGGSSTILTMRTNIQGNLQAGTTTYKGKNSAGTEGADIHVTSDGGSVILGNKDVYLPVGSSVPGNIVVIKTSPGGTVSWMHDYGTYNYREQGYAIQQTSDGGYIVAGMMETHTDRTKPNILLMKLRSNGTLEWRKEYQDATDGLTAYAVQEADGGGYIVAGEVYTPGSHDRNAFMMKVDRDGAFGWYRNFGGMGMWEIFHSVSKASQGGCIASGSRGDDMYVVKVNDDGSLAWAKNYAGPAGGADIAYDIKRSLNIYMIAGQVNGSKACLMRINANGDVEWAKAYAPPGTSTVARSVVFSELGFTIGGESSSNGGDFYLVKTDGDGDAGCHTETISLETASVGGSSSVYLGTLANGDFEIGDDIARADGSIAEQQICFSQEERNFSGAVLPDRAYRHDYAPAPNPDGEEWETSDYAIEPFNDADHVWRSEAIWVRPVPDNVIADRLVGEMYEHEFRNDGPDFSQGTNYIYVPVENHGNAASDAATLEVYWSLASTNLQWPNHWIDYRGEDDILKGDIIASVPIPSIPAGGLYVAEIPWDTPDPGNYGDRTPAVSFLARFVSPSDPMTSEETVNTAQNAVNNNNINWRNEIIVSAADMSPDGPAAKTIYIRGGNLNGEEVTALSFSVPEEERGLNPMFTGGRVIIDLGQDLYERWAEAGFAGTNVEPYAGTEVIITGEAASIEGLELGDDEEFPISIRFEYQDVNLPYPQYYHYDLTQSGGIGGVTFELRFPADEYDGLEKPSMPATGTAAGHAGMTIDARPNPAAGTTRINYTIPETTRGSIVIYDINGRLVRTLVPEREMTAGTHTAQWDGTGADGAAVSNGVYIYRLATSAGTVNRQIMIVR